MPPVPANNSDRVIDATSWGLNCPQFEPKMDSIDYNDVREILYWGDIGEDCLSLSVWAPLHPECKPLPVFIFIHGGSYQAGGSTVPYQNPSKWIERTQSHIVVSIQYRLNIFGFPNAAGLETQNVGLLDQRMAIKWVQANIAAFGGDPSRMILFGQSAGGQSTDIQNFAFPDDPVVQGFMPLSGSSLLGINTTDLDRTGFSQAAALCNCSTPDPAAELACMQKVPMDKLLEAVEAIDVIGLVFAPVADEKTYFNNYTERLLEGHVSDRPVVYGTTLNEGVTFVDYPEDPDTQTPDLDVAELFRLSRFLCPVSNLIQLRQQVGKPTWFREYRGNFTNVSPRWWIGAAHGADLPLIFGTAGDFRSPETPFETQVSHKMQDFMMAFALDPLNGLSKAGWSDSTSNTYLAIAAEKNGTGHGGNNDGLVTVEQPLQSVFNICKDFPLYLPPVPIE